MAVSRTWSRDFFLRQTATAGIDRASLTSSSNNEKTSLQLSTPPAQGPFEWQRFSAALRLLIVRCRSGSYQSLTSAQYTCLEQVHNSCEYQFGGSCGKDRTFTTEWSSAVKTTEYSSTKQLTNYCHLYLNHTELKLIFRINCIILHQPNFNGKTNSACFAICLPSKSDHKTTRNANLHLWPSNIPRSRLAQLSRENI